MRRKALTIAAVLGAASLIGTAPGETQSFVILSSIHWKDVQKILLEQGLEAEIFGDERLARIAGTTADGVRFVVDGFDCAEDGTCATIRFQAGWLDMEVSAARQVTDEFNRQFAYGRAFLDKDGNPIVQLFATMDGGVTFAHVNSQVRTWQGYVVPAFLSLLQGPRTLSEAPAGTDGATASIQLSENAGNAGESAPNLPGADAFHARYETVSAAYDAVPPVGNGDAGLPDHMNRLAGPSTQTEPSPDLGNWLNQY